MDQGRTRTVQKYSIYDLDEGCPIVVQRFQLKQEAEVWHQVGTFKSEKLLSWVINDGRFNKKQLSPTDININTFLWEHSSDFGPYRRCIAAAQHKDS